MVINSKVLRLFPFVSTSIIERSTNIGGDIQNISNADNIVQTSGGTQNVSSNVSQDTTTNVIQTDQTVVRTISDAQGAAAGRDARDERSTESPRDASNAAPNNIAGGFMRSKLANNISPNKDKYIAVFLYLCVTMK